MQRPFGLNLELPRKGSTMVSTFDPSVDAFVLAEQMRSGKLVGDPLQSPWEIR